MNKDKSLFDSMLEGAEHIAKSSSMSYSTGYKTSRAMTMLALAVRHPRAGVKILGESISLAAEGMAVGARSAHETYSDVIEELQKRPKVEVRTVEA